MHVHSLISIDGFVVNARRSRCKAIGLPEAKPWKLVELSLYFVTQMYCSDVVIGHENQSLAYWKNTLSKPLFLLINRIAFTP